MSAASDSSLDLREQITRIDRMIAETQKFQDEARQLDREARKFERDRTTSALIAGPTILTAGAAIGGLLVKLFLD